MSRFWSRRRGTLRTAIARGMPIRFRAWGLACWILPHSGVTLGGTMRASGTTPPVVTIAGTLAQLVGLHIEIDSVAGGVDLGQATFKWSVNNGATYVATGVATAASVVLGSTGITALFAAGPYNIDNKWDGTVSAIADRSGAGNDVTAGSAAFQPQFHVAGINGKPTLDYDAGTRRQRTGSTITVTSFAILEVVKLRSAGNFTLFAFFDAAADQNWIYTGLNQSVRAIRGTVQSYKNASAGAGWLPAATKAVAHTYDGTHVGNLAYVNNVALSTADVTVNDPGVAPVTGMLIIGTNAGVTTAVNGYIGETAMFTSVPYASAMTRLQSYFKGMWGAA